MKKVMYGAGLLLAFVIPSQAQRMVPEKVTSAFHDKFPHVDRTSWEKENENEWEGEFKMDGTEYSASFTSNGDWIETEREIKKSEIPGDIIAIINKAYSDYEIEEAEMGENQQGKFYEFEIEVGEKEYEVMIDANGKLTSKASDEERDED